MVTRRVLLVGNPNVGKSALFNALTGRHTIVSNYPGTTVEVARGSFSSADGPVEVLDSPGVNSLLPLSEDERVTWDLLASARQDPGALVVQVADAKDLRRGLMLTLQLGQLAVPTVLALNMSDEAEARGQSIDTEALSRALGVPVRATVATRGEGIGALRAAMREARPPTNHLPLTGDLSESGGADRARDGSRLSDASGDMSEDIALSVASLFSGTAPLLDPEAPPPFVPRYHEAMLARAAALAGRVVF